MRLKMRLVLISAVNLLLLLFAIAITVQSTGFGFPVSDGLFQNLSIQTQGISRLIASVPLRGLNSELTPWLGGVIVICLITKEFLNLKHSVKISINLVAVITFSAYFAAIIHMLDVTTPT